MDATNFGRYQLLGLVGEGGMGKVFKAHDTAIDRDVAIKLLPTDLASEPGYRERFRREAHAAARLTEPHIMPIYDFGEIDSRLYLVMPIVEGIDVGALLKRDGPMSPSRAVRVIGQLAAALDAAHAHGLVHRDVKPSNALMAGREFVYLIDFGIAHDAAATTTLTSTGAVVGTPAYMAPERFTTGDVDARADVYALTCVLYECLTGDKPYPGDSMDQQIAGHLSLDPPRPSEHRSGVPGGFDEVIARGMAKKPDVRYQSAGDLAVAAHAALTTPQRHQAASTAHRSQVGTREASRLPITAWERPAEYKQVTVLFADVVHSMDLAAAVGAERWREIMTELVDSSAAVVQRYGGRVDKFTGDGIMAVFGAPTALEDHAFRACLGALDIQAETIELAKEVQARDGIALQLRIGLNSGQVVAGDIGAGPLGYTAVGEQVGMAQRMESVAPPGGVMLSEATARLVEGAAALGEPELVQIKGSDQPVLAQRLLGMGERHRAVGRAESSLVGRRWEMSALEGLLERAVDGHGAVVGVAGSAGIGKSRLVREVAAMAAARGVEVFTAFCESHTSDIAFQVVARLLRAATGVGDLDEPAARAQVRARTPDADPEDLLLLDDLLGIADPNVQLPKIDPDARRRRLTALVNAASLARESAAVYVVEDAHWIDEVSEAMLAEFLTAIPQTPSLMLITYRPEYRGALSRITGAQTVALAPLSDPETAALVTDLLGSDPSVGEVATMIVERAAGNPFFAEEMVRDLAERAVLRGDRGAYVSTADVGEVSVPATLQATIAARIDRLDPAAKRTLRAAAVIGSRFSRDLLETLGIDPVLQQLLAVELINQIRFTREPEYVFHHPLIRTVAYESQLKSDRAELHRRVAAAIESRDPAAAEENAALIAEHLEAAGDLHAAYGWHMRAAHWLTNRDIAAARQSWERARTIADAVPAEDPDRLVMQIAPLTRLCGSMWMAGGSVADTGFEELRELCEASGDKRSLAVGMAGLVMALAGHQRLHEASELASELTAMVEALGNRALTVNLLTAAIYAKSEVGELTEALRLAQRVIDLADGDVTIRAKVFGSALALATRMRGLIRLCLGDDGWRLDADAAIAMAGSLAPKNYVVAIFYKYIVAIPVGALLADSVALSQTADALRMAEQASDEYTLAAAQLTRGLVLVNHGGPSRQEEGFMLLNQARDAALAKGFTMNALAIVGPEIARDKARNGDLDGAIELSRAAIDDMFERGAMFLRGVATTILVESLLQRDAEGDLQEAQAAIDRLAEVPVEPGFVLHEIPLLRLRALLARARGDEASYRGFRDRYRAMATSLGFEGHIAWAEAMP